MITYTIEHHKIDETQPEYMQIYESALQDMHYKLDNYLLTVRVETAMSQAIKGLSISTLPIHCIAC